MTNNDPFQVSSSHSSSSNEAGDEYTSSETSEIETAGSNAAWINEMDMSDRYIIRVCTAVAVTWLFELKLLF